MGERDRRQHRRYRLWIPVQLFREGADQVYGVAHDFSENGALLVTAQMLEVGSEVKLHAELPPAGGKHWSVSCEVLRVTRNELDPEGMWPYQVALKFHQANPAIVEALRGQTEVLQGRSETSEQLA